MRFADASGGYDAFYKKANESMAPPVPESENGVAAQMNIRRPRFCFG